MSEPARIGKRGTIVIPAKLRRRFGIEEGSLVLVDESPEGVLIRPAVALPIEVYSRERKAEFLLNNAVGPRDYARARAVVKKELGVDPDSIPHVRPRA